ncbi:MAG: aminoacyl-tRNA hydrolase [Clostridia bacterium]|nr:aminoacyl-tRNA hydrolase [Clostridia bacterium]
MKAIIGLGNPGSEYARTRHNVGFDVMDLLSEKLNAPIKKIKCRALIGDCIIGGEKVLLVKPQTFMNNSGFTVSDVMQFYKLQPQDILLVVDDIDLPHGQVRLCAKGGPGTHNGLRHIVQCTGSGDFPRIRVGVGAPPPEWDLVDWVLGKYRTEEERKTAFDAYLLAVDAALCWAEHGIDLAMNRYNKRNA